MRAPFRSALVGIVPLFASAAMAQPTPVSAVSVTGDLDKQTYDFVQAYAAATPRLHQIARWSDPICVQVTGLPDDKAAVIKGRIEEVAKDVGVKTAPANCVSNIQIVFTTAPQRVIDTVAAKQEILLGYEHRNDKSLRTVSHPIQGWYVTATIGGGGDTAGAMFAQLGAATGGQGIGMQTHDRVVDDPTLTPPTGCGDSRFSACLKSVLNNVLVTVDLKRAADKNLGVISDYVSMLALSQPRSLNACAPMPSITDLFLECARPAPDGLTPTDAAYLTALYSTDPEASAARQPTDIASRMSKMLVAAK